MPNKMHLSDHDLRQIDDAYIESLDLEQLLGLCKRLVKDLKEARDRLNQNPKNSSRPPSSSDPWIEAKIEEKEEDCEETEESDSTDEGKELEESEPVDDNPDESNEECCKEEKDSKKESSNCLFSWFWIILAHFPNSGNTVETSSFSNFIQIN